MSPTPLARRFARYYIASRKGSGEVGGSIQRRPRASSIASKGSLTSPTRQVGHDHVFAEMELGLEEDPPASGTPLIVVEWFEDGAEARRALVEAVRRFHSQAAMAADRADKEAFRPR